MRLLVLRPEPDASDTAARLRALGHDVIVEPMLSVELRPEPLNLPDPLAILFTSRNGVRAVEGWPRAALWRDRPSFAVGGETAACARAAGFSEVRAGGGDAAALAELVAAALAPVEGTILYPAARDRAGDLEGILTARGFSVHVVEAYRAIPATRLSEGAATALRSGALDGALVYSRRTAETFRDLAGAAGLDRLPGIAFYVVSAAVAEPLRALRPAAIHVAARPDATLALIPPGH
jgi:uroporphyrinogen-III synthase